MEKEAINAAIKQATGIDGDFNSDLNAIHEAEKFLTDEQWYYYARNLFTFASKIHRKRLDSTASQRAEAFLKTLNLWQASPSDTEEQKI